MGLWIQYHMIDRVGFVDTEDLSQSLVSIFQVHIQYHMSAFNGNLESPSSDCEDGIGRI